jgi:hypothetical protein
MARSRGLKAAHRGSLRSILDRALPRVRDQHADDLDRASAYLHRLAVHRGKPVADKVCQQLAGKPFSINISRVAPARPYVGEHFQGSALLGTKRHRCGEQCQISAPSPGTMPER